MTRNPRGRPWAPIGLILELPFALGACGGGHATTSSGGARTPSGFDFGANEPQLVDAFGDSITEGELEGGQVTSDNYPNNLQTMLRGLDPNWRVNNRGVGGETVEQGARRLPNALASDHPGFVLIMGVVLAEIFSGMNDPSLWGSPGGDPHHPNEGGYRVMAGIWFDAMRHAIPTGPAAERAKGGGTTQSAQSRKPAKRR
ncbi:MAG: hypothetical protein HYV62_07235 [Candidatus Rokubacteria bacterium]|nr:hypothetical protein [Candidatus Rokubacteria bacterium]